MRVALESPVVAERESSYPEVVDKLPDTGEPGELRSCEGPKVAPKLSSSLGVLAKLGPNIWPLSAKFEKSRAEV